MWSALSDDVQSRPSTGDGYILGFEAGAELTDMEMFQFYPVSMVYPKFLRVSISISQASCSMPVWKGSWRRSIPSTRACNPGQTFAGHLPRDQEGSAYGSWGRLSGGFEFRSRTLPETISYRVPIRPGSGIDLKKDGLRWLRSPLHDGWNQVGPDCRTNIRGLFAAGEVTGGLHGANRLANNALMEIFVSKDCWNPCRSVCAGRKRKGSPSRSRGGCKA